MSAYLTAAEALLLTPFIGGSLFVLACVVGWVARVERTKPDGGGSDA